MSEFYITTLYDSDDMIVQDGEEVPLIRDRVTWNTSRSLEDSIEDARQRFAQRTMHRLEDVEVLTDPDDLARVEDGREQPLVMDTATREREVARIVGESLSWVTIEKHVLPNE